MTTAIFAVVLVKQLIQFSMMVHLLSKEPTIGWSLSPLWIMIAINEGMGPNESCVLWLSLILIRI